MMEGPLGLADLTAQNALLLDHEGCVDDTTLSTMMLSTLAECSLETGWSCFGRLMIDKVNAIVHVPRSSDGSRNATDFA